MENFAEIIATLSYIPAGLVFGLLIYLPQFNVITNNSFKFWPFIVALISLIVSAAIINGLKLNYRRYKFVHFYIILVAELFLLTAGFIFIFAENALEKAIYISALGLGLSWIPGLSYITIRSKGKYRSLFASFCSFNYLCGLASMMSIFDLVKDKTFVFGILLAAISGLMIILIAINELLHQENFNGYNYAKPLDYDVVTSHDNGRLVFHYAKAKVFTEFKIWNSSEEDIIVREESKENYHSLWAFYNILTKLQGFVTFYWIVLIYGVLSIMNLFQDEYSAFAIFWFIALGSLVGTMSTLLVNNRIIYITSSVLQILSLILCTIFIYHPVKLSGRPELGISHLLFFTFAGLSYGIPSINILEVSPLNFNESLLAIGIIFEILAISMLQYYSDVVINNDQIVGYYIGAMVLCAILCTIVVLHMPNFEGYSLIEINNEMRKLNSYTVFTRDSNIDTRVFPTTSTLSNRTLPDSSREFDQPRAMRTPSLRENVPPPPPMPYTMTSQKAGNSKDHSRSYITSKSYTEGVQVREKKEQSPNFEYNSIRADKLMPRAHLSTISPLNKNYMKN